MGLPRGIEKSDKKAIQKNEVYWRDFLFSLSEEKEWKKVVESIKKKFKR